MRSYKIPPWSAGKYCQRAPLRAEPAPSRARTPPSPHGLSIIRNTREAGAVSRNTKYNTDVNRDTDTDVNTDTDTFEGLSIIRSVQCSQTW